MALKLEGVTKKVSGEIHIDNISLELKPGSFNVLLGRTLAGKTTLMRLMAGLDKPTSGQVLLHGKNITSYPVQKRKVAMVYQQFINYPSMTVYNNIASPLKLAKLSNTEIDRRVREIAEIMHIEPLLERLPRELSGGQQQRTAMARALVKDADLLLFDEPLVNLDYKLREQLRVEMREIFKRRKVVAVYATTEPIEALTLGGNIAVLDEGRLLQFGPTVKVYNNPKLVRVGEVFSDPPINLFPGRRENDTLLLEGDIHLPLEGHLRMLPPGSFQIGVRANHLFLRRQSSADIEVVAETRLAEISGSETYIHVRHNGSDWVVQEDGVHKLHMGQNVTVFLNPRNMFAFDESGRLRATPERTVLGDGL
jgi:glycerol transport system ATP-binding protein